jgi:hypothetical protein
MTPDAMRRYVANVVREAGSYRAAADMLGVDVGYLHRVANGNQEPGPDMLDALGLKAVVSYQPTNGS